MGLRDDGVLAGGTRERGPVCNVPRPPGLCRRPAFVRSRPTRCDGVPVTAGRLPHGCGSSGGRGRAAGLTACRTRPHPAHRSHRPRADRRTQPRRCDSDVDRTGRL